MAVAFSLVKVIEFFEESVNGVVEVAIGVHVYCCCVC